MPLTRVLGGVSAAARRRRAAGAGLTAYAAWEARAVHAAPGRGTAAAAGARPLRVLHLSDIHMTPGQRRKQEWLSGLATLRPDLVVDTGDNLAHAAAVPVVRDALGPLLDAPGRLRLRLQRLLQPDAAQPAALPAARRRAPQHRRPSSCRGPTCATPSPPRAGST